MENLFIWISMGYFVFTCFLLIRISIYKRALKNLADSYIRLSDRYRILENNYLVVHKESNK